MPGCLLTHPAGSSTAADHFSYCILFLSTSLLVPYLSSAYGMMGVHCTMQEEAADRHRSEETAVRRLILPADPLHRGPAAKPG